MKISIVLLGLVLSLSLSAKTKFGAVKTMDGKKRLFYEDRGEYGLIEGDILLEKANGHKAVSRRMRKWKDGIVPYVIDPAIPNQKRIIDAIAHYHTYTGIRLVERTDEKDYVYFKENGSADCSSFVGRKGGRQIINVPDWCGKGSMVHEIMHALGFYHEQSRPDRRKYIKIKWFNIKLKRWFNFFMHPFAKAYGEFDFDSIMLYPSRNSFARDPKKPTIVKRDGSEFGSQRRGLSEGDLAALKSFYKY